MWMNGIWDPQCYPKFNDDGSIDVSVDAICEPMEPDHEDPNLYNYRNYDNYYDWYGYILIQDDEVIPDPKIIESGLNDGIASKFMLNKILIGLIIYLGFYL